MIRVNLLPWREARRKALNLQFYILIGMVAGLAASIVLLVHGYYAARISTQMERNHFLTGENAKLDKEIAEIKKLKEEIQALLARKRVIETLQVDRAQAVRLLDQLVRQTPDGVGLVTVTQTGHKVKLKGVAQSNARVSTVMRNIEASPYLEKPELVVTRGKTFDDKRWPKLVLKRVYGFEMDVSIKPPQTDSGKGGAGKKAGAKK